MPGEILKNVVNLVFNFVSDGIESVRKDYREKGPGAAASNRYSLILGAALVLAGIMLYFNLAPVVAYDKGAKGLLELPEDRLKTAIVMDGAFARLGARELVFKKLTIRDVRPEKEKGEDVSLVSYDLSIDAKGSGRRYVKGEIKVVKRGGVWFFYSQRFEKWLPLMQS